MASRFHAYRKKLRVSRALTHRNATVLWVVVFFCICGVLTCSSMLRPAPKSLVTCGNSPMVDPPWEALTGDDAKPPRLWDLVVHRRNAAGEDVKVLFVALSTKIDDAVCRSVASAYLSGVPVVIAGYDVRFAYRHKMNFALTAAREAGLSEKDVVVYMDSDSMFTGMDPFDFIDRFINSSPSSLAELDSHAVRNGTVMAPFYFSTEEYCSAWNTLGVGMSCKALWGAMNRLHTQVHRPNVQKKHHTDYRVDQFNATRYPTPYVNSGAVVSRFWSLELVNNRFQRVADETVRLAESPETVDIDDQSFLQLLLFELLLDEMRQAGVPSSSDKLPLGLINLDYHQHISTSLWRSFHLVEYNLHKWSPALSQHVHRPNEDVHAILGENYSAYDTCASQREVVDFVRPVLRKVPLPLKWRNFTVGSTTFRSVVTPPLFSRRHQENVGFAYPILRHFPAFRKSARMDNAAPFLAWGVPILFDAEARRNSHSVLRSIDILTHTPWRKHTVRTHKFPDKCPYIFRKWSTDGFVV